MFDCAAAKKKDSQKLNNGLVKSIVLKSYGEGTNISLKNEQLDQFSDGNEGTPNVPSGATSCFKIEMIVAAVW